MKGHSLKPIHASQIKLVQKREQPDLQYNGDIYQLLVYADLIRMGQAREKKWAIEQIGRKM